VHTLGSYILFYSIIVCAKLSLLQCGGKCTRVLLVISVQLTVIQIVVIYARLFLICPSIQIHVDD